MAAAQSNYCIGGPTNERGWGDGGEAGFEGGDVHMALINFYQELAALLFLTAPFSG